MNPKRKFPFYILETKMGGKLRGVGSLRPPIILTTRMTELPVPVGSDSRDFELELAGSRTAAMMV